MLEDIEVECGGVVFGRYPPPGKLEVNPILLSPSVYCSRVEASLIYVLKWYHVLLVDLILQRAMDLLFKQKSRRGVVYRNLLIFV